MPNLCAKTRKVDSPYATFISPMMPGWEWRLLKTYKQPKGEDKDPFARWFVTAKSPHTFGEFEMGDTYKAVIMQIPMLKVIQHSDEFANNYPGGLTRA